MVRNKSLIFYLVLSLVCLRLVGMHIHLHNHSESVPAGESEVPHLSTTLEHGGLHEQGIDKDVLGASLVKKSGQSTNQDTWSFVVAVFILVLMVIQASFRSLLRTFNPIPVFRHLRPPVLAPPR